MTCSKGCTFYRQYEQVLFLVFDLKIGCKRCFCNKLFEESSSTSLPSDAFFLNPLPLLLKVSSFGRHQKVVALRVLSFHHRLSFPVAFANPGLLESRSRSEPSSARLCSLNPRKSQTFRRTISKQRGFLRLDGISTILRASSIRAWNVRVYFCVCGFVAGCTRSKPRFSAGPKTVPRIYQNEYKCEEICEVVTYLWYIGLNGNVLCAVVALVAIEQWILCVYTNHQS